jgi:PAS domain-containing protein
MALSTVFLLIAMVVAASIALFVVSDSREYGRGVAKRLETAMRDLESIRRNAELGRMFEEVQAELPIGLVLVAPDERIVLHNSRAAELLDVDALGAPASLSDLAGSTDVINSMRQAIHQRRNAAGIIVPQPGRSVDVSAQPLDSGNTLIVLQDVSELRHLRTVRRDFVANVSHAARLNPAACRHP